MKDDMTKDKRRLTICTHKIMAGEETGWNIAEFILSVSLSICTKEVSTESVYNHLLNTVAGLQLHFSKWRWGPCQR